MSEIETAPANETILSLRNLTVRYGRQVAVDGVNLDIARGDIYGLIGPNGAGKTSTFRVLATVQKPSDGEALIDGMRMRDKTLLREIRRRIGYMPDSFGVYEDMTVEEYLTFFAAAYDIRNPKRRRLVEDVLELVELGSRRADLIDSLSRGMQQRLGIARVLIHDPALLILDEPASGLDPRARIEIRGLLLELQKMGKTIFISSHILADLAEICNRVAIIEKGRILADGDLDAILSRVRPSPVVALRVDDSERAAALLRSMPFVRDARIQKGIVAVEVTEGFTEVWRISRALVEAGLRLAYIEQEPRSLERAFVELTQGTIS